MAQRYRKVEVSLYGDEKFRRLSAPRPCAQWLWVWLLTSDKTIAIPGVVVGREAELAGSLGWSLESLREAFAEVFAAGLAEADWDAGIVLLPKALLDSHGDPRDTSKPTSPNVIKSWAKVWRELPDSHLKLVLLQRIQAFAEACGPAFAKAFKEAFAKALREGFAKTSPKTSRLRIQDTGDRTDLSPASEPPVPDDKSADAVKAASLAAMDFGKRAAELASRIWFEHCDRHTALNLPGTRPLVRTEHAFGWRELRDRIRVYTDLEQAEADMRHVLNVREAEARKERTGRYFGENVWSEKSVSVGLTLKAAGPVSVAAPLEFVRKPIHPALLDAEEDVA